MERFEFVYTPKKHEVKRKELNQERKVERRKLDSLKKLVSIRIQSRNVKPQTQSAA